MNRTSPILGLLAAALLVLPITPCLEDGARHMLWQVEDCTCHEFGESRSEPGESLRHGRVHQHAAPHSHGDPHDHAPCGVIVDASVQGLVPVLLEGTDRPDADMLFALPLPAAFAIGPLDIDVRAADVPGAAPPPTEAPRCAPLLC